MIQNEFEIPSELYEEMILDQEREAWEADQRQRHAKQLALVHLGMLIEELQG